jgi:hypothetical protein
MRAGAARRLAAGMVVLLVGAVVLPVRSDARPRQDALTHFCASLEAYLAASAAVDSDPEVDPSAEFRTVMESSYAALPELPGEVAQGDFDAAVDACGVAPPDRGAPDRASLEQALTADGDVSPPAAECIAGHLVDEFDEDTRVALRDGGVRAVPEADLDRYLRLVVACLARPVESSGASDPRDGPDPAALADQDEAEATVAQTTEVLDHRVFAPFVGWTVADADEEHVHVADGVRQTISTPVDGDPVEVWLFGGDGLFGTAQRDDHTIASELVAAAADDGVALEVTNFGVPGYRNHQETVLLAERLGVVDPPDLVVFYDGLTDLEAVVGGSAAGLPFVRDPGHGYAAAFQETVAANQDRAVLADGQGLLARAGPPIPAQEAAVRVVEQYEQGVAFGRTLAEAYGFEVVHVWAPDVHSKTLVEDERPVLTRLGLDGWRAEQWRAISAAVRDRLPGGVRDLSGALDQVSAPVLVDAAELNELGAGVVADRLWDEVRPVVEPEGSG